MALWDFLRPLTQFAFDVDPFVKLIVLLFAVGLFVIAFKAYSKTKSKKLMFVATAFAFFGFKWLLKVIDLFFSPGWFFSDPVENIFELLIFVSLFMALFKK